MLDIVCHRYPGTKPSDYYEFDDDYTALQFDMAMAFKGFLKDAERNNDNVYTLLTGMRAIMMSNGAKPGKIPKPKKLVRPEPTTELPSINQILEALGSKGAVINDRT